MTTVRIELLGGFQLSVDDLVLPAPAWNRRQAAALVKLLALRPDRRLHREQLMDRLWPDDPMPRAATKLHKAAHYARVRTGHPATIVLRGEAVQLFPDVDVTVDVVEFERDAALALADGDTDLAVRATSRYRGELLPDDPYEDWLTGPRERARGRYLALLALLERWEDILTVDAAHERAHVALMRRYAAAGDRGDALRQFDRLERTLRAEVGLEPGAEAVRLRHDLLRCAPLDLRPFTGRRVARQFRLPLERPR